MTRRTAVLATALLLATCSLHAQTNSGRDFKMTLEEAEILVPRIPLHPVKSSVIHTGDSPAIDTLSTLNDQVKIILYSDNTWQYWKDPALVTDTDNFNENWENQSPDAYHIPYAELPAQWNIWLTDNASQFKCPLTGTIGPRGKFGMRRKRRHQGIDLPLTVGTPIYAAFDGKVRVSRVANGYGNLVVIRHTNGLETFYGHLSSRKVEVGDWVNAGDVIGLGGNTGRSTGPHLHFETRFKGYAFDPQWIIDFKTGDLRQQFFVLKKKYFSPNSSYEQDFEDEVLNEEDDIKEEQAAKAAAAAAAAVQYHTIKSGDTLGKLAIKYHTSVKAICRLNGIKETTILQLGKRLRVR